MNKWWTNNEQMMQKWLTNEQTMKKLWTNDEQICQTVRKIRINVPLGEQCLWRQQTSRVQQ